MASDDGATPRLGVLDELVGYHMRRASAVIATDFSRATAGTGMRQVLFGVLSIIEANPGINQGAVGRALGIQRANMVSLVNELDERGLIARRTASDDRRAFSLTLTPAGQRILADSLARLRQHEDDVLSNLSGTERATLILLLSRIEARSN
ncbi:MarR family winged helix-turn-helix transcriptional regulator [Sphingomonas sp.]|jgi:DNA-binding MarR family transcriptional regulator|uniref:MarR family winged helix-turn-helix transcriptional regulator n=1 Tax=Sphingomonas sp. TaxID=28214 RepID=UPI002D7F478C|nr:MarR family transcriptional regulator [Sphingomonas sp.]HEU0043956.1 MarR family transcriptional regulator [Sphingomonas sp.]